MITRLSAARREASDVRRQPPSTSTYPGPSFDDSDEHSSASEGNSRAQSWIHDTLQDSHSREATYRTMGRTVKRSRDTSENIDGKDLRKALHDRDAVAVVLYTTRSPDPRANDIWPDRRSAAKLPARYTLLDTNAATGHASRSKRRPAKKSSKDTAGSSKTQTEQHEQFQHTDNGRPEWRLPVEMVELIAQYLNRDDIKSLRLVSRELNCFVSQVIFQTVVVPFNTEIYGMLGPLPKPDVKGKGRATIKNPDYSWKNASGDELYNGHGLDVFRGFGKYILRFGMSFEVDEETLAMPPVKTLTEKKTSFWGHYDWPFEDYRRFDAVAGLETAADETPRMKVAFSELTKIKELALSVDSGLGWLNGPDKSIKARVLQRPPQVFGSSKAIPDRRAQAQDALWTLIEHCHQKAGSDITTAILYRFNGQRPLPELNEAAMIANEQPDTPYLDLRLILEAAPHDTSHVQMPKSADDLEALAHLSTPQPTCGTGVLFSAPMNPEEAGQIAGPIIPAFLTKAQKEWLLETEWAQRAFLSSYMLSVIDNPTTFKSVHTLNIARLSDNYISALSRADFWDALPNLTEVTLMVLPTWRTVRKDEAGFVHTCDKDPTRAMMRLCELLGQHVAPRSRIRVLTIGCATGGEHAEGLYARNRLIFPAPIWATDIGTDAATLASNDLNQMSSALLHFPYVERLSLKNCWLTPHALRAFVQIHDSYRLKHLVLNSVSLTAILRRQAHPNQPGQPGAVANQVMGQALAAGALWNAPINGVGQAAQLAHMPIVNQQQFLQLYITTLQVQLHQLQANAMNAAQQNQIIALQNQLHQQSQTLQNPNNLPQHGQAQAQAQPPMQQQQQAQPQFQLNAVTNLASQVQHIHLQVNAGIAQALLANIPANNPSSVNCRSALKSRPREGSWMNIIDVISPGTNLSDFGSDHSQADSERSTSLQSVEFVSCGYAKLPHTAVDQSAIEFRRGQLVANLRNPMLSKRINLLSNAMLNAKWIALAEIVQDVDPSELAALDAGWHLKTGWEDAKAANAALFDGVMPGGTGRFSGVIRRSDRVVDAASAS